MEKKSRLGRGLSSLLSSTQSTESKPVEDSDAEPVFPPEQFSHPGWIVPRLLTEIDTDRIKPNPYQPRRVFSDESLRALAESIKVAGVIQPIIVREDFDRYILIAGERRWRAAQLSGMKMIPVIVRNHIDNVQQAQLALIENIHREDLNPIDRAIAYEALITRCELTHFELAEKLSVDRSSVSNHLRLLQLQPAVREMMIAGTLSMGHGKLLAGVPNTNEQLRLATLVVNNQISVRELEKLLNDLPISPIAKSDAAPLPSAHIADLERRISRDLQMRTEVKQARKGGKGRIVIHYASLDQFDQLMQRLNVKIDD